MPLNWILINHDALRSIDFDGLLDDSGLFGANILYAWWLLLLRYHVFTSKLVEQRQQGLGTSGAEA